jgi:hypothetical protein
LKHAMTVRTNGVRSHELRRADACSGERQPVVALEKALSPLPVCCGEIKVAECAPLALGPGTSVELVD